MIIIKNSNNNFKLNILINNAIKKNTINIKEKDKKKYSIKSL